MARIRTIKPEFPQSESMGRVSRDARLLFVQLWTHCDDQGRARGNSRMLASLLFPYDDDAPSLIDGWLEELEGEACVARYTVGGDTYVQVQNWAKHQKIDKPTPSRLPQFDEASRKVSTPRELSSEVLVPSTVVPGPRTTDIPDAGASVPAVVPRVVSENEIFPSSEDLHLAIQHWNFQAPQFGLAQVKDFTDKRRRALKARLVKLQTLDAWIALVDSLEHRPFCRGENQRGWRIDFDFLIGEGGFTKICEGNWLKPGMSVELEAAHASG